MFYTKIEAKTSSASFEHVRARALVCVCFHLNKSRRSPFFEASFSSVKSAAAAAAATKRSPAWREKLPCMRSSGVNRFIKVLLNVEALSV